MNRNILLTYRNKEDNFVYEWFETVEECKDFIEDNDNIVEVNDCLDCSNAKKIDLKNIN